MSLLLAAAGCSWFEPDLSVGAIQPAELRVGSEVQVLGQGFSQDVRVEIVGDDGRHPLESLTVKGAMLIEGRVPDVEPGTYTLVVTRDSVTATAALVVGTDRVGERPCARGYEANTQLSLPRGVAIIDRFYADGKRERVETPIEQIERLEYQVERLEDGRSCASIVLRRTDGAAVLFEDDEKDLLARAETLAEFMEKDLAIVE